MGGHFRVPIYDDILWDDMEQHLPNEFTLYLADSSSYEVAKVVEQIKEPPKMSTTDEEEDSTSTTDSQAIEVNYKLIRLPVVKYHEEQFFPRPTTVLVVGNESVGLSKASYGFAHKHGGKRVHIPLMNGVNSLNSVTAISIIAYEFRRQMYAFEDGLQALESSSSELG